METEHKSRYKGVFTIGRKRVEFVSSLNNFNENNLWFNILNKLEMSRCSQCGINIESYGIKIKNFTFCDPQCLFEKFPNIESIQQMFRLESFRWFVIEDEE